MLDETKVFYRSSDGLELCGLFTVPQNPKGYTLLAHGITTDKNEWNNFYVDLAQELRKQHFASLRFDFRGHGESAGAQRDITVIGELLDVKASANEVIKRGKNGVSIIATSFGAGSAIMYAAQNKDNVRCLTLLSPVLDYLATFLEPIVPWAKDSFNTDGFQHLDKNGFLLLDGEFELGAKLVEEFKILKPYEYLKQIACPVLTIHGDKDSMVPYEVSKRYGTPNKDSEFVSLEGADHGFVDSEDDIGMSKKSISNRALVIARIVDWVEKWG